MKTLFLICLLLLPKLIFAQQQEKIKQAANEMSSAYIKKDYATLVNYTYPRAVTMNGGKAAMIKTVTIAVKQMEQQGFSMKSASVGMPENIVTIGKRQFCNVPETIVLNNPNGTLSSLSYLLAISEDKGAHWYFLNAGSMKDENIYQLFPELKGKMKLPKQGEPIFSPVK